MKYLLLFLSLMFFSCSSGPERGHNINSEELSPDLYWIKNTYRDDRHGGFMSKKLKAFKIKYPDKEIICIWGDSNGFNGYDRGFYILTRKK